MKMNKKTQKIGTKMGDKIKIFNNEVDVCEDKQTIMYWDAGEYHYDNIVLFFKKIRNGEIEIISTGKKK